MGGWLNCLVTESPEYTAVRAELRRHRMKEARQRVHAPWLCEVLRSWPSLCSWLVMKAWTVVVTGGWGWLGRSMREFSEVRETCFIQMGVLVAWIWHTHETLAICVIHCPLYLSFLCVKLFFSLPCPEELTWAESQPAWWKGFVEISLVFSAS